MNWAVSVIRFIKMGIRTEKFARRFIDDDGGRSYRRALMARFDFGKAPDRYHRELIVLKDFEFHFELAFNKEAVDLPEASDDWAVIRAVAGIGAGPYIGCMGR